MIPNLKLIFRAIAKNKMLLLVNVTGLSIGLTTAFLLFYFVGFERTFDQFHPKSDRIYRVLWNNYASPNAFLGPQLTGEFPKIESFTRLCMISNDMSYVNKKSELIQFHEENGLWADSTFFDFFSFPLLSGNVMEALTEPNSIVLTEKLATKYFGGSDPIGEMIKFGEGSYKVTGVMQNLPSNTHLRFDFLVSMITYQVNRPQVFEPATGIHANGFFTYVLLHEKQSEDLEEDITMYIRKVREVDEGTAVLQPLESVHLHSNGIMMDMGYHGDIELVNYLFTAGLLIMFLSWINHINLTVSENNKRIKEFGVKRSFGASNGNLYVQVFVESLFVKILVCMIFVGLLFALSETYYNYFQAPLTIDYLIYVLNKSFAFKLFIVIFFVGIILSAGLPAIAASQFKMILALNSKDNIVQGVDYRKGMLFFQYVISMTLLIASFGIFNQVHYLLNKDYGIDLTNTVVLVNPTTIRDTSAITNNSFKNELYQIPGVQHVSITTGIPGKEINRKGKVARLSAEMDEANSMDILFIDDEYFLLYKAEFISGRNFNSEIEKNSQYIILNETASFSLGFENPDEAVNVRVKTFWGAEFTIIGVVKDYNHLSPKLASYPTVFLSMGIGLPARIYYSIKLSNEGPVTTDNASFQKVQSVWSEMNPESAFNFFFLESYFNSQLKTDIEFREIVTVLSIISVVLTLFGVVALSSLYASQKLKEVGIRKILGASSLSVYGRITSVFAVLLLVASILSCPLAVWYLNEWLNNYASKVNIDMWTIMLPLAFVSLLTLVASSYHVIKASNSNPVDVLKDQ